MLESSDGGSSLRDPRLETGGTGADDNASTQVRQPDACVAGGLCRELGHGIADTMDLLLVMDDSATMAEEKERVIAQLPRFIDAVVTGQRYPGDPRPFSPIVDLHVGVVTGDMGLIGVSGVAGCEGYGADGIQRRPSDYACNGGAADLRFLSYQLGVTPAPQFSQDVQCLAAAGAEGCRHQQPLEAALKALWPRVDIDPVTNAVIPFPRVTFLTAAGDERATGHGDVENHSFLRNNPQQGLSLIMVVIVTDSDDCSALEPAIFTPEMSLRSGDLGFGVPANLRCTALRDRLYSITDRYAPWLRALREGHDERLIYAVIAGVPGDLVNDAARSGVDFTNSEQRDAYYDGILSDQRMRQEAELDDNGVPTRLRRSCSGKHVDASPPTRLVQLAKALGEQSVVASLCEEDPLLTVEPLIEKVASRKYPDCLPKRSANDTDGLLACRVIWELPPPGQAAVATPTACSQREEFLSLDERNPIHDGGGERCIVTQRAAVGGFEEGWVYDATSDEAKQLCGTSGALARFTPGAKPPTGVRVFIDCEPGAVEQ